MDEIVIKPQPKQEEFLSTPADIAIWGGSAGSGKTWSLLFEPIRYKDTPGFNAVIFRRETPQITNPGGLWKEASDIYPLLGGKMNQQRLEFKFKNSTIKFSHLEKESTKYNWQGAQVCFIGFDEITHFTQSQFWYMLRCNRSMCGIMPYVRATCNPDPDSFVADLISWWINQDTGYAIPERSGIIRWFVRVKDVLYWDDTKEDLLKRFPNERPKSLTFIPAKIEDNKKLLEKDPGYIANLNALPYVERMRQKEGNWKIRNTAGNVFQRAWFEIVDAIPGEVYKTARAWDRAATKPNKANRDPDWTVGLKLVKDRNGVMYISDVQRFRETSLTTKINIKNTATQDGIEVEGALEQEPGASGKSESEDLVRFLAGYNYRAYPARKKKILRAKPVSAQAEAGNIKVLRAGWNEAFLMELQNFDGNDKGHDDQVDALSLAFEVLNETTPIVKESHIASVDYSEERKSII